MAFEYAIALTGGIAAGKSTVADIFSEHGFNIIDADKISHAILDERHADIISMFGSGFVAEGKVDRKSLGFVIFSDKKKKKELEDLLHPLIYERIESEAKRLDEKRTPYLVDIPLFFENERYPIKRVIVVSTTKEQQLRQLMERNGYTKEAAKERINCQLPLEDKKKRATYLIENTSTLDNLKTECDITIRKIHGERWG